MSLDPCFRVIASLEDHPSRLNKEAIVQAQAEAGNAEFFAGCRLALDSMITFGLKQINEKTDADGPGLPWDSFALAITGLVTRNVTGNTARDMVNTMMKSATRAEWNGWYRRILIKDLRCGVSEKTINKVVGGKYAQYSIPVFSCQLAHDSANHESKVAGKKRIEVKLDGVRVITIVYPDGRCDQFSRNGKELVNFPHIREQLKLNAGTFTEPMVLDGEVMSSSFQDLMKQVHRKDNVQANDAVLWLFDAVPLTDFEQGKCAISQKTRSEWLNTWYETKLTKSMANVHCLDHAVVDLDSEEGQRLFAMYNKSAIENGYEGIMIKDLDAAYECKRSTAWLKLKPFIEVTLGVTDVEEGTGKNLGRLGALVCTGIDDGKEITVNVGSGFSDELRDSIWADRDGVVGQLVEVRADAVTQNQDGTYSLRFPRFKTFRGFELGEKL
jgi:DNA ligase-1